MKAISLCTASLMLAAACGPGPRKSGQNTGADPDASSTSLIDAGSPTSFPDAESCEDSIDVVFVLDVSSSMGFVLQQLEQNIAGVVTAANRLAPQGDAHFGLIAFADNYALDKTGNLESGKVHTAAATLVSAFATDRTTYTNRNRNPGDGPTGLTSQNPICEENANDSLYAAATEFPWRTNATRVVIVATDDTFLDRPDNYGDRDNDGDTTSTNFPREGNYPAQRTMAESVAKLKEAKIRVFSFTKLTPPGDLDFDKCGTGRRLDWARITDGWTTPYNGQSPFPIATQGANFDLDKVKNNTLSLADTINQVVLGSRCVPVE
jgi:hypothetical protein